jgi:hypothetical protein
MLTVVFMDHLHSKSRTLGRTIRTNYLAYWTWDALQVE